MEHIDNEYNLEAMIKLFRNIQKKPLKCKTASISNML
jgi:hypothetical protein